MISGDHVQSMRYDLSTAVDLSVENLVMYAGTEVGAIEDRPAASELVRRIFGLDYVRECRWLGGAKGSRTPDLLNAIQALYQLSYGPTPSGVTATKAASYAGQTATSSHRAASSSSRGAR